MNQPLLLHIVERLEGFVGKLPNSIQKPVLHELTPLKELFLQQRAPRFVLTGSPRLSLDESLNKLFGMLPSSSHSLAELFRWQTIEIGGGKIEVLDARGGDENALRLAGEELRRRPADMILQFDGGDAHELQSFASAQQAKIVGISTNDARPFPPNGDASPSRRTSPTLHDALQSTAVPRENFAGIVDLEAEAPPRFFALLARELPNEARIELARISRDRVLQTEIAQLLIKSTAAICTAIGAQPIPLADLPILTTLQLVMVSGIMYISGRERSMRAATEFIGALGVNVGAGMIFREGARAALKFFPGWGNVICGMVAGAGTYAVGRAATLFFIEGASLKEARRAYLASRKRRGAQATLPATGGRDSGR